MDKIKPMVDMSISPREEAEKINVLMDTSMDQPQYPYGLRIRLTQDELEKLDVDYSDWNIGDLFHLHAMARLTSISSNSTESGEQCCAELQIIALAGESEDAENVEYDAKHKAKNPYKKNNNDED